MIQRKILWLGASFIIMLCAMVLNMGMGSQFATPLQVLDVFQNFNEDSYQDYIIRDQRLPRTLIAVFVGASLAVGGDVLQGITRNPLASPSLLGVTSGAMMFVVFFGFYLSIPLEYHGFIAMAGGWFGFLTCYFVARMAGFANDPRGLTLILAGALVSVLYASVAKALVLSDQQLWGILRDWINGDINHAYGDRLHSLWIFGVLCLGGVYALARPLTLIALGHDTARAVGVNVRVVLGVALFCVLGATTTAVSIIGPVGFIGLVVPHMVRPFAGANFAYSLPMNACIGGAVACVVDSIARTVFLPVVIHSAAVMEFVGGLVFIFMVRKFYNAKHTQGAGA